MSTFGSYIVRKNDGSYVSAYSSALGERKALSYAIDCAKFSKGKVFYKSSEGAEEVVAEYADGKVPLN